MSLLPHCAERCCADSIFLQELRKQTEDEQLKTDITKAIDTIQSVLDSANDAIDKEHLASAVTDLSQRVDDWKSLKVEGFGELLRFGTFAVLKGDSGKDTEREVRSIYVTYVAEDLWSDFARPAGYGLQVRLCLCYDPTSCIYSSPRSHRFEWRPVLSEAFDIFEDLEMESGWHSHARRPSTASRKSDHGSLAARIKNMHAFLFRTAFTAPLLPLFLIGIWNALLPKYQA